MALPPYVAWLIVGAAPVLPQVNPTMTVPAVCVQVRNGVVDGVVVEKPVDDPTASKATATVHRPPGGSGGRHYPSSSQVSSSVVTDVRPVFVATVQPTDTSWAMLVTMPK